MNALEIIRRTLRLKADHPFNDTTFSSWITAGATTDAGKVVNETTSLGLTAVYRSASILAGTVASLPLKSYRRETDDSRTRVRTALDNPGQGSGLTPFAWKEVVMCHLVFHGNAYLYHLTSPTTGNLIGLQPLYPPTVTVERKNGLKTFRVATDAGERVWTEREVTHIMGLSTDGIVGLSPIAAARNALGTGLAADASAGRMFANGLMMGGIVSSDENLDVEQAKAIKEGLKRHLAGPDKAGDIAVVNASLKFSPWTMNADDAQFIESRRFQVEEVARIFGIPKVLLAEDGASTWGSGIAELIRGMQRFTFMPYTSRIEEALSAILPRPQYVEFDYAGLLQPTEAEAAANIEREINCGTLTINEARKLRNRPPIAGGDVIMPRAPMGAGASNATEG